ncbi:DUF2491 family protein [Fulvimarina sp. 2208YS6-2-32]|uniref:DUF2491 family protein n=1 Tax=Fulvimarina uroteuthidis TaxID=3098149 RepID=A0ABU5I4V0_9HYPH|nr:DUF2491 family protein [Fulvimarina sp. 2208YS6-2-32]MDY8110399.1 DUF2491 family protein [Fulvimarina sp. 2208YS6-2-32]
MIFSLFGKKTPETELPAEVGPLGIPIGGALELDLLSLEADASASQPGMALPHGGTFVCVAYGEARLDANTVLSRYYDDDDRLLQVLSASGRFGDAIDDISIYHPWDSVVPAGQSEWDRWVGASGMVGEARYDADGVVFDRFWGEGEERADLVEFVEDIDDGRQKRAIHQTCMLYSRPLGRTREMLLINVERELSAGSARQGGSIEFLLGYGLGAADVRRV